MLNDNEAIQLLREKQINVTQPRIKVLKIIYNDCPPVFGANVFAKFDGTMNRISVHRILMFLVKKKILCTVPNTKGIVEYSLQKKMKRELTQ